MELRADIYDALMREAAAQDLAPALLAAVWSKESGFDPLAVGDEGHSYGLGQLYDRGAGAGHPAAKLLEVDYNARVSAEYLARCLQAFGGDELQGVSAYNQGIQGARENGWRFNESYVLGVLAERDRFLREGLRRAGGGNGATPAPKPVEVYPIVGAFGELIQRAGPGWLALFGRPRGPVAYSGRQALQDFERCVMLWYDGHGVQVLFKAEVG